jgi:hypothetical protein
MIRELKVALGLTVFFIIIYFITGAITVKYTNISFFPFNITNCLLEMEIQDFIDKKCLCPDSLNFQNCSPTGQKYVNSPSECKKCQPPKTPFIVIIAGVILIIFLILTVLSWINVFTKTIKFK